VDATLLALTVALLIAGLANAPTLISGNTLVPASVSPTAVTEAYTRLTVSIFAGIAVGAPIAGVIIDHTSGQAALLPASPPAPSPRSPRCSPTGPCPPPPQARPEAIHRTTADRSTPGYGLAEAVAHAAGTALEAESRAGRLHSSGAGSDTRTRYPSRAVRT